MSSAPGPRRSTTHPTHLPSRNPPSLPSGMFVASADGAPLPAPARTARAPTPDAAASAADAVALRSFFNVPSSRVAATVATPYGSAAGEGGAGGKRGDHAKRMPACGVCVIA